MTARSRTDSHAETSEAYTEEVTEEQPIDARWDTASMSDDDVAAAYRRSLANVGHNYGPPSPEFYLREFSRRQSATREESVQEQTKTIRRPTWFIAGPTVVNVIVATVSIWTG